MGWDLVTKTCRRLMAGIVSPQDDSPDLGAKHGVAVNLNNVGAEADDNPQPKPYSPELHRQRSESSLHLSC